MDVRVVDWNVNGWHTIKRDQIELIRSFSPDVVMLQEVTQQSFEALLAADLGEGVIAKNFLPEGHRGAAKGSLVQFWAALFVRSDWRMTKARVLADLPSPERSVVARVDGPVRFLAASLAVPPGVTWFERKREQGEQIARWMDSRRHPVVAGIDRNGPKTEDDSGGVTQWPHDSPRLVQPGHLRHVQDVYRATGGPAVSFRRGHGERQTPCRYDAIYASRAFVVKDVQYVYDEAIAAGSDHGLVFAELELPS